MTPQEALSVGKEAVEALVKAKSSDCTFPFDEVWTYVKTPVPSPSRPAVARKLQRMGYIELTGSLARAVTSARAGSPTREYRPGKHFRPEVIETAKKALLWNPDVLDKALKAAGLVFRAGLPQRLTAALLAKPFVILTGLSGSGKTKLAQAFATWICEHDESGESEQYVIQAVGSDWTNRDPLLGYPDALSPGDYRMPNSGVLSLILRAMGNPSVPHFLILDEMNLSHVERYFADVLSAMEAGQPIPLHENNEYEGKDWNDVPGEIILPPNLFIIGTVNVDETTYMFSPKVLDRAHVIEFSVSKDEVSLFLTTPRPIDLSKLTASGVSYAQAFVAAAADHSASSDSLSPPDRDSVKSALEAVFEALASIGAEFGYRAAYEISRFVFFHNKMAGSTWHVDVAIDAAVMQKILPKLHGSKTKLDPVLTELRKTITTDRFPISLAKIERMQLRLKQNGFTSYAEA